MSDEIAKLEAEREELLALLKPLEAKLKINFAKLAAAREAVVAKKLADNPLDWETLLHCDAQGSRAVQSALEKVLEPYHLRRHGYFPAAMQSAIQLAVPHDADDAYLEKMAEGIELVLPHLKPVSGKDFNLREMILFDLMEHTLAEHASYNVAFDPALRRWHLVKWRYHVPSRVSEHEDLMDLLKTIRAAHPYPGA